MKHTNALTYPQLPEGIRHRNVDNGNGLNVNFLEAGFDGKKESCLLLLHGFPELAYSWRKVMMPLANQGYHLVAPDLRGYGATTGWNNDYDGDLEHFNTANLLQDNIGLLHALGHKECFVAGHDFGSPVAAYCALARPDIFRAVALMSAPFAGLPQETSLPTSEKESANQNIHNELASLLPSRKHYQWYYSSRKANEEMVNCKQGIHDFLRAYYHHKSADWKKNIPHPLKFWTAVELAKLPTYYVMHLDQSMPETVAKEMPSAEEIKKCEWLRDSELSFYAKTYQHTGFQGGLQYYRNSTSGNFIKELQNLKNRTIDVPSTFIAGKNDWGIHQKPGAFEDMRKQALTDMRGCHLVDDAGHWVQQEQPQAVATILIEFLNNID